MSSVKKTHAMRRETPSFLLWTENRSPLIAANCPVWTYRVCYNVNYRLLTQAASQKKLSLVAIPLTLVERMKELHSRCHNSIIGYMALLTTTAGIALFVVSLFLPATRGGESGFFMLMLGLFGSFGMVPSDQPALWVYSLLGTLLNLTLWAAPAKSFFSPKAERAVFRSSCGVVLVAGSLVLALLPPPNAYGVIGYRVWVNSFLLVGIGLLLSTLGRSSEKAAAEL